MSPAPHPPGRSPPDSVPLRFHARGRSSCRRALARPGRSSSPLRGCGRSTWTRIGHPTAPSNYRGDNGNELGQYERARQLGEDTLTRYRRVLGDDHPDTLRSAHNLATVAADLANLGRLQQ
jgi:hypothetical protein